MKVFTLLIGGAALFIAGCAAYFSVRGIALTFGAVSSFTIPIIIMASSLEFGKLIAASFLYRHWKTCNKTLRTYLSFAVVLLIGITSAGIYGYLSQAFEQTLNQVEGYEREIGSLQRQQGEYDRLVSAYRTSGQKGSVLREEKQSDERKRLESYISERRADIKDAEASKANYAEQTDQMIVGERGRREAEQKRLESVIVIRREDIGALEAQKREYKEEVDSRIKLELAKEERVNQLLAQLDLEEQAKESKVNERLAQLDAAVKVYRDKGRTFLEDGIKKANELLKNQSAEREGLRSTISGIREAAQKERDSLRATLAGITLEAQKARDDLDKRYVALDDRIALVQKEISEASLKITGLTTGGAEQADNIKTALETLQVARSGADSRIAKLETEIADASRKLTALSETESVFGPDSSAELEAKKGELLAKKEDAEQQILSLEGKIRATDIGSFKFVARAFDSEVAAAEATENPILIKEAMDNAVNRVVKWFILILVVVFDPLAVTLVIAYNASLLGKKENDFDTEATPEGKEKETPERSFFRMANLPLILIVGLVVAWGGYSYLTSNSTDLSSEKNSKSALLGDLSARRFDDRSFAYVPGQAFGTSAFSGVRMMEQVGVPKILSSYLTDRIPFLGDLAWDPRSCGINPEGRVLYFMQFPGSDYIDSRTHDVVLGLVMPIGDQDLLKEFILQELDLKSQSPNWKVHENNSPEFLSIRHKTAHVSLGMDDHCLVMLTSWWHDKPDPAFLNKELEQIFLFGQGSDTSVSAFSGRLSGNDYDFAISLNGTNFFENFRKTSQEEALFNVFRDYLSFQLTAKAKESTGEVSLEGEYDYVKPVLDADFGLRVAGKLEEFRDGSDSNGLSKAYGNFVEIFLQRLDFQTTVDLLGRIDLSKSTGFEDFDPDSVGSGSRLRDNSTGVFSLNLNSRKSGGESLCLMIDFLVAALNPLGPPTAVSTVSDDE
ncbi:MAG: hypothetical protein CMI29_02890 [Opitutae bacterium]|nr:hypothetical protein [Opitutae bacterium]